MNSHAASGPCETDIAADRSERALTLFVGIVFLWLILNGVANALFFPSLPSSGSPDAVKTVAAAAWRYRLDVADLLLETLSGVLLEFGLYLLLKRVNERIAFLALLFMFQDSCISAVLRGLNFARVGLYTSQTTALAALPPQQAADLIRFVGGYMEKVGGIIFGIGLLLFFCLFLRSSYLPRILSVFGVVVSSVWIAIYLVILMSPDVSTTVQYSAFALLAATNVLAGIFLVRFGVARKNVPQ